MSENQDPVAAENPEAPKDSIVTTSSFLAELRGGASGEISDTAPTTGSKFKLTGPTLVLLAVAGAGGALLVGMRQLGLKVASAAEPVTIDYTPADQKTVTTRACDRIIAVLERSGTPIQVPGDQIHKNPFLLIEQKAAETPSVDPDADKKRDAERKAKEAATRLAKIEQAAGGLRLLGVLGGKVPVARVNADTVRVGDTVAEYFTVTAIGGRSVTLQCDEKDYVITMEEPKSKSGNGTSKAAPKQPK